MFKNLNISIPGNTVVAALNPLVFLEHEAVLGGFSCLYWLVKHEITHHTNYSALLDLAQLLGCQYFEKLKASVLNSILLCWFACPE